MSCVCPSRNGTMLRGKREKTDFPFTQNTKKSCYIRRHINNGPKQTVAELEEQAKSGKPVSLMELAQASRQEKKPSVLAKLCPPVNEPKKTARSKRAERELL